MEQTPHATTHTQRSEALSVPILRGRWLVLARAAWLFLAGVCVLVFVLSIPITFTQLEHVCTYATCGAPYLSSQDLPELAKMGLSVTFFATYFTVAAMLFALVWVVIGLLIFWHKSTEPRALLFALFLVSFGTIFTEDPTNTLAVVHPTLWWFAAAIDSLNLTCFFLFLYLFPNGRFAPRWMVWLLLAFLLLQITGNLFPTSPLNTNNGGPLAGAFFLMLVGSILFSLIYRYRHATPVEQQQTKWVLFAIVLALVLYAPAAIFGPTDALLSQFVGSTVLYVALSLIPIAIAISILRYRLWDIDTLINKALVYGALTGLLAGLFVGLVFGLDSLIGFFSKQPSQPVVTVISTLAIAALFQPLRWRIQRVIDRRFYRRKYDAEKVLAAFSGTLRTDVNLEDLRTQLLRVVQETMQPEHISLWLRRPARDPKSRE